MLIITFFHRFQYVHFFSHFKILTVWNYLSTDSNLQLLLAEGSHDVGTGMNLIWAVHIVMASVDLCALFEKMLHSLEREKSQA